MSEPDGEIRSNERPAGSDNGAIVKERSRALESGTSRVIDQASLRPRTYVPASQSGRSNSSRDGHRGYIQPRSRLLASRWAHLLRASVLSAEL